ncbi:Blue copper protein [Apostasia shenzhenica]|uniref:Blue copper protein n=1 Tax=Apostasia shenzhenica TaxID=1088818 RepID=A0A2H9ZS95_9ASPA|nr:Blue copper protein [Apostasia shenzhenica]
MASHHHLLFLLLLPISLILLSAGRRAACEEYRVGGEDGWINGNNYLRWSQQFNFSVGDVLVFSYVKGQHNVFDVTEAAFRSCNAELGVNKRYESGDDRVELRRAATYFFICNTPGHCLGGMKFSVSVQPAASGNPPAAEPAPEGNGAPRWRGLGGFVIVMIMMMLG